MLTVVACNRGESNEPVAITRVAAPTEHPLFAVNGTQQSELATRDIFSAPPETPTPESSPTTISEPVANVTPTTDITQTELVTTTVVIYDETLNSAWTLHNSEDHEFSIFNQDRPHNGQNSMSITPQIEYGEIAFTVREGTPINYPREQVLGVSFWLNSGDAFMENDDLLVAISGSNALTYYDPDDDSVQPIVTDGPTFSETRLYFLGVNGDLPANTWIRIIVWLDDLQYDPLYEYVTGIWLINDEDFFQTYYIDEVQLILVDGEAQE